MFVQPFLHRNQLKATKIIMQKNKNKEPSSTNFTTRKNIKFYSFIFTCVAALKRLPIHRFSVVIVTFSGPLGLYD